MIPVNASDRWYIITLLSLFHSTTSPPLYSHVSPPPKYRLSLFQSLKQAAFPRTAHNLLSVFTYFILLLFFLIVHYLIVVLRALNHLFMRMDASRVCYDEVSDQRRNFWEHATKRRAKGHRSAKSESCFPITPACSPLSHAVCPSFTTTTTHLRIIDLTHEAFQWKMISMIRYIRIWMLN